MLLTADYAGGIDAIYSAVLAGTVTRERVDESVARILRWKIDLGLIVPD
jgi:beta-glucosidase-like glycosyl hydrolase